MLPPHSGHTQFRMPDITSELAFTVPHLETCIRTSTSPKELSATCHPPSSCRAHCLITKLDRLLHAFCLPTLRTKIGCRSDQKTRPSYRSQHQRQMWQFAESDSRLRSPASPRSFIPLRRRLVLSAFSWRRRFVEPDSQHIVRPRFELSRPARAPVTPVEIGILSKCGRCVDGATVIWFHKAIPPPRFCSCH